MDKWFIPYFTGYVITYPCWDWSLSTFIKGAPGDLPWKIQLSLGTVCCIQMYDKSKGLILKISKFIVYHKLFSNESSPHVINWSINMSSSKIQHSHTGVCNFEKYSQTPELPLWRPNSHIARLFVSALVSQDRYNRHKRFWTACIQIWIWWKLANEVCIDAMPVIPISITGTS